MASLSYTGMAQSSGAQASKNSLRIKVDSSVAMTSFAGRFAERSRDPVSENNWILAAVLAAEVV
jgi:hypothetical protein